MDVVRKDMQVIEVTKEDAENQMETDDPCWDLAKS